MRQPIQAFAILNLFLAGFVILSSCATVRRQQISLRDIGSPPGRLQIERWSGPFFNEDEQKSAFQSLVSGDSQGSKRRLIDGIDPERILNPIPEKPIKKEVKPQLPEAETYIGANPDEKEVYVSPQERLATLVSKPIIHDSIETENAKVRSHTHEDEHKMVRHGSKRKYMFSPNHDRDDEEDGSPEGREQSDFESDRRSKEDEDSADRIGGLEDVTSFAKGHTENEEPFHLDSRDESDALENLEKFREDEHSSVEDEEQTDKDKDAERGEDDRESDSKRRSKVVRPNKTPSSSFIESNELASTVTKRRFRRSFISSFKNIRETKVAAVRKKSNDFSPSDKRISSHESALRETPATETTLHHQSNKKPSTSNVETGKATAAESHKKRSLKSKEREILASSTDAEAIKSKNKKSEVTHTITISNFEKAPAAEKSNKSDGKSLKRYFGSTEHQSGLLEENAADEIDGHMGGYMGDVPRLMTIGTHDGSDMHKEWNNMHSPGNGFYSGAGVGPARTQEGEYIHHNQDDGEEGMHADAFGGFGHLSHPYGGGNGIGYGIHHGSGWGIHGMGHSMGYGGEHAIVGAGIGYHHNINGVEGDVLHSLGGSAAISDHHTADVIDGIWGHDESDDHVGRRKHHHGSEGMVSYFGHNDHGALLPAETLDGFVDHWDHSGASGHDWTDGYAAAVTGHEGIAHGKLRAIQAIQDDPNIDNELQTFGIGTEVAGHHGHHNLRGGGHHGIGLPSFDHHDVGMYGHSLGHGGHGHYGFEHDFHHGFRNGHNFHHGFLEHGQAEISPVDMHHHDEMSPEEYHAHIDSLMQRYHHLEEDMKGQHGGLMDHLDEHLLHQHGHPHYHSGYDLYAYKNPWDNVRLPYHVPVENHPMMDEEAPDPGGGSIELGGKGDNKGEEKGGPLVEAKPDEPESKPPEKSKKKEDKPKPKPKPKPVKQLPDWTGAPPRIPDQRGGPQISGSIGLGETESLPSSTRKGSALQQAIAAYKSMNLTVPPALQIQALQEQLKEAEEKNNLLLGQASKVTDTQLPSGDVAGEATTSARMNDTSASSSDNEENEPAETKTKRPEKQSPGKIPEADAARLIPQTGTNAAAKLNGLQQIDMLQQSLKNMLTNAAGAAIHDSEKVSDEKALLLQPSNSHSDSTAQQQAKCGGRSCVPEEDDGDKDNSESATASTGTDGHALDKGGLQGLLANMYMNQGALKTSPSKGNQLTPTIDETGTDSEDGTSSLSETSVKESEATAEGSLARLLSSVGLGAGKRGRAKKKHHKNTPDSPYSRIGYEESSNADTSKISFANSLALGQRSETSTPSSAQAVEKISQTHSPIEAPFSTDEDGVFSKKAEIKEVSKTNR